MVVFYGGAIAWILLASQCPLSETVKVVKLLWADNLPANFAASIHLQTTEDGLDQWATPLGPIWTVHADTILPFLMSEQARDIYEPAGHQVRPGDIVLDCGANVGSFTRTALSRGARLVVAIEPAPNTIRALRRNFEKEIVQGRVIVYPKGVWDHDDVLALSVDEGNQGSNSVVLAGGSTKVQVPLTTIDKIAAELQLPRVDFIKMDIEGAEKQAIAGGANTIRKFRPRLSLSTEHLTDDFVAVPAAVDAVSPSVYTHRGCDCGLRRFSIKALVLAFDPRS